jgi:hypothetical protein
VVSLPSVSADVITGSRKALSSGLARPSVCQRTQVTKAIIPQLSSAIFQRVSRR